MDCIFYLCLHLSPPCWKACLLASPFTRPSPSFPVFSLSSSPAAWYAMMVPSVLSRWNHRSILWYALLRFLQPSPFWWSVMLRTPYFYSGLCYQNRLPVSPVGLWGTFSHIPPTGSQWVSSSTNLSWPSVSSWPLFLLFPLCSCPSSVHHCHHLYFPKSPVLRRVSFLCPWMSLELPSSVCMKCHLSSPSNASSNSTFSGMLLAFRNWTDNGSELTWWHILRLFKYLV